MKLVIQKQQLNLLKSILIQTNHSLIVNYEKIHEISHIDCRKNIYLILNKFKLHQRLSDESQMLKTHSTSADLREHIAHDNSLQQRTGATLAVSQ